MAILAGVTSGSVLADVKVRLRTGNNFVIESRAGGTDKFVVNQTVGATTGAPTSTGISAANNAIGDVLDPVQDQDAATKAYADSLDKTGTVADHEGWLHPTIEIGAQTWMADNMYVTSYSGANSKTGKDIANKVWAKDGSTNKFPFPSGKDYLNGGSEVDKNSIATKMFGNLYQWAAAMDGVSSDAAVPGTTQGICPSGWHIPTDGDWKVLEGALGMTVADQDSTGWRGSDQSKQLQAGGTSGFNALLSGYRGENGSFFLCGYSSALWSATEETSDTAFRRYLLKQNETVYRAGSSKTFGFSVRCLKN